MSEWDDRRGDEETSHGLCPCQTCVAHKQQLTESNRQLREELEQTKQQKDEIVHSWKQVLEIGLTQKAKIHTLTTALAAAKEALESDAMWAFDNNQPLEMRCSYHTGGDLTMGPNNCKAFFVKRKEALARIAECEKGTA